MRRIICFICLFLGWPMYAIARDDVQIDYEELFQHQRYQHANIGISRYTPLPGLRYGVTTLSIPGYYPDPYHPDYFNLFFYFSSSGTGAISPFVEGGIDLGSLVGLTINGMMANAFCNNQDSYSYSDCWASNFITITPDFLFTLGLRFSLGFGSIGAFWRYYWLDNEIEQAGRSYYGVRYSLRF